MVVRGMIMHTGTIFMYIERAALTGMQNPQRSTHGCWIEMPLLCFCTEASTALLYRNQLWPLSVPALLDEKIMDPWLWCTRFYTEATVCSRRTHCSLSAAVGIDTQDSHLNFKNGVLFATIFYIFLPHPPAHLCSCVHLRGSWEMSFVHQTPTVMLFILCMTESSGTKCLREFVVWGV